MTDELDRRLAELSEKLARRGKLDAMLESLRADEQALMERAAGLRAILDKENADVEKLEGLSLASILSAISGTKGEKLEKEQYEAYSARLRYDAAARQLDDCRAQMATLTEERDSLADAARQYREVLAQTAEKLRDDPAYAEDICRLERAIGESASRIREIAEAISAGTEAANQLAYIEDDLLAAERWGTFDMLGGGLISGLAKHSYINEAQEGVERLQALLTRFGSEIADVRLSAPEFVVVDEFLRFADYFFDGLFSDATVLARINTAQESMKGIQEQLYAALSRLDSMQKEAAAEKDRLEQELGRVVSASAEK